MILHAGFHKTGTTAIQSFAHKNSKELFRQGIIYPDCDFSSKNNAEAHHEVAHAVADKGKYLQMNQVPAIVAEWKRLAEISSSRLLVSSEVFCRHVDLEYSGSWNESRRSYLKKVADLFSEFKITIVLVIRRQDSFAKSFFQEKVMKNNSAGRRPFSSFLKQFLKEDQYSFLQSINLFEEFFPEIKVLTYEDLVGGAGLCNNFFSSLGVDTSSMEQVGIVRKSMTPPKTLLKIFLNKAISSSKQNKQVINWINSHEVSSLLESYYGDKVYDFWESIDQRRNFLSNFAQENEILRARFFSEKIELFPPVKSSISPEIPRLTDELKAQTVLIGRCFKDQSPQKKPLPVKSTLLSRFKTRITNMLARNE